MVFKINISDKGRTYKIETESEVLVGKSIGETFNGEDISPELKGYEIKITGHSDLSGIPGFKGLEGDVYHKRLLTFGPGMKDKRKGMRLRKTNRGEQISLKTHQINSIVEKQGEKKFDELFKQAPAEENAEEPAKEEQPKSEEKPEENKKE